MTRFDVVVIGEALLEFHTSSATTVGGPITASFSGDALNTAAAAARAGAHTALLTNIGADEVGEELLTRLSALDIDTSLVGRSIRPNGAYLNAPDGRGGRRLSYWRSGSAASSLSADDVRRHRGPLTSAAALIVSGITAALSTDCADAVLTAARLASDAGVHVTYDPNYRPALASPDDARACLAAIAPYVSLLTPSCPPDTLALFGTDDADTAIDLALDLGVGAVAATLGAGGVRWSGGAAGAGHGGRLTLPALRVEDVVDSTGAGDVFAGTVSARIALRDDAMTALRLAVVAAGLSTRGHGGAGYLPDISEVRRTVDDPAAIRASADGARA